MTELFSFLTNVQPIGVIALLGIVIYMLVKEQKGLWRRQNAATETDDHGQPITLKTIATNHLHELPEMAETLRRMESTLNELAKDMSYIRGRMNSKDR